MSTVPRTTLPAPDYDNHLPIFGGFQRSRLPTTETITHPKTYRKATPDAFFQLSVLPRREIRVDDGLVQALHGRFPGERSKGGAETGTGCMRPHETIAQDGRVSGGVVD